MSTQSYSSLLSGMWGPEGSDINQRLEKLQKLEKLRKEREAQRQLSQPASSYGTRVRSRLRSSENDSQNNPAAYWTDKFESDLGDTYGGARPKFSSSREEEPEEDWNQMFQNVTGDILNRPMDDSQSSFRRDRIGRSESDDNFRQKYGSSFRSRDRPTYSSRYNRSNSQPEEHGGDIFSGISGSLLGRTEQGPSSVRSYEPGSFSRRRYERTNEEVVSTEEDQQQVENGESQSEEVIEIVDEEESEEPMHFIERLKNGGNTYNDENGINQKRNVNSFLDTNMPTLQPLKKLKPDENDVKSDEEHYEEVTQYIHPVEDIVSVAKDINAAFGSRSPRISDSRSEPNSAETGINFTFQTNGTSQHDSTDLSPSQDFVFTASTPNNSSASKYVRTSGTKRKQKPSSKGKNDSAGKNMSVPSAEEAGKRIDETDNTEPSFVYEVIELPEDSFAAEQNELAAMTKDLYKSRLSEYVDKDQTPGKLDTMQEFFSGKEVRGDPKIWRVLNGSRVATELDTSINDSPPKERKEESRPTKGKKEEDKEKEFGLSLGDKLTKLKTMTDQKSKRYSKDSKDETKNKQSKFSPPSKDKESESVNRRKSLPAETEAKKSPRDLVNDVRELKKFIHENVSEPPTPTFETQISIDKRPVKEISTQTDFSDIVYTCKHCGKSSSETIDRGKKSDTKTNKLDLRVDTKNPSQNYAVLEKKHLAEINKEMKVNNKASTETDSKKVLNGSKPKVAGTSRSYMKGTASSNNKTSGPVEKNRKGSVPEINKIKDNETQRTKSPVGFLKSGKNIVAQRAKAFDNASGKNNGSQKTKPGLSLYRGSSVDRQKNEDLTPKSTKQNTKILKSKSLEQVHVFPDEKTGSSKADKTKTHVKQKSLDNEIDMQVENKESRAEQTSLDDKVESTIQNAQTEVSVESNVPPSPGSKRTRAQMTQKVMPPALSPKPVRRVESPIVISPEPRSPLHKAKTSAFDKPPSGWHTDGDGHKVELHSQEHVHGSPHINIEPVKKVETTGQFTTLQDNPFIKNDAKRRNSLHGRKDGESVWERERSRSRDSSLRRSNTSAGERSSLTHLSWSDSGSTESLPASVSSSRGSNSNLQRTRSERLGSVSSITSQNSMLNLLDTKGTKTNVVTGMKETNVDEAYEEYIASKDSSEKGENQVDNLNDSSLIDFAQKTCHLLEFEIKKRDSSSDSNENDGKAKTDSGNTHGHVTENGKSHMKNGVLDNSNAANEKAGKKSTKQKKGFFKGKLFNK